MSPIQPTSRTRAPLVVLAVCVLAPLAGATHGDGSYDQPVYIPWDTAVLDVLVVPPTHGVLVRDPPADSASRLDPAELDPYANTYLAAVLASIADWDAGVAEFGPAWLRDGLALRVYVVGRDEVPEAALRDPEVVVTTAEEAGVWAGAAVSFTPEEGPLCVVTNTKLGTRASWSYREMYGLNAHEFGHCLGLDHPGADAEPDFHPREDVMAYGPLSWTKCVSNLNVLGLQLVYGPLFGQPGGDVATLPVGDYHQRDCAAQPAPQA